MYFVGTAPANGGGREKIFMSEEVYNKGRTHEKGHAEDTFKIYTHTVPKVQKKISESDCYFESKAKALKYFKLAVPTKVLKQHFCEL